MAAIPLSALPPADTLQSAADALRQARARRQPVARISASHGIAGLDAAYAVAELNTRARLADGRRIVGKKVGLTSRAVQQQLGVDQPDFGVLFDDMECLDGDEVAMSRLIQPKVEAEVAFVIGRELRHEAPSWGEFVASLDCALPAIEIVDSATDWKITLVDTVADNASSGLYLLGQRPVGIGQLASSELGMQMTVNGATVSVGSGAACLGHPLREGEVVLSGALGPMAAVSRADQVSVRIGGLGECALRMV